MFGRMAMLSSVAVIGMMPGWARADALQKFESLHQREWRWRMQQEPIAARDFGEASSALLDQVDLKTQRAKLAYWRSVAEQLRQIEVAELSAPKQVDFHVYQAQIADLIRQQESEAYLFPINSDSNFYSSLAQLSVLPVNPSTADLKRQLQLLAEIPRYLAQQQSLLEIALKAGKTPPQVVLLGREQSLDQLLKLDVQESEFYRPFKALPKSTEAAKLQQQASVILKNQLWPALQKLRNFLVDEYFAKARTSLGAYQMPGGKSFYAAQVKYFTTLTLTPEEIHQIGLQEVGKIESEMSQIMGELKRPRSESLADFIAQLRVDPTFHAQSAVELLKEASYLSKRIEAQLPKYFGLLPRQPLAVEKVPDDIAAFYTAGRYVGGSMELGKPGTYWVNTSKLPSRPLYLLPALTLHEGVPGHHLQAALAAESAALPPFRRFVYISAYGEGWALYAEYLGREMGIYETPQQRFGQLSYQMWRAARLVLDTGVHTKGWSRQQARDYLLARTALSEHEISTEVDRYISWPAQALSYKLGEIEIRALRARAQEELGATFDIRAFHDEILAQGSVPLSVLRAQMNTWIKKREAAHLKAR